MTFDTTIHIPEVLMFLGAVLGLFKTGMALRDSVRDLTGAVTDLKDELRDHESRLRNLEGVRRSRIDRV